MSNPAVTLTALGWAAQTKKRYQGNPTASERSIPNTSHGTANSKAERPSATTAATVWRLAVTSRMSAILPLVGTAGQAENYIHVLRRVPPPRRKGPALPRQHRDVGQHRLSHRDPLAVHVRRSRRQDRGPIG